MKLTWTWQLVVLCAVIAASGVAAIALKQPEAGGALLLVLAGLAGITNKKEEP